MTALLDAPPLVVVVPAYPAALVLPAVLPPKPMVLDTPVLKVATSKPKLLLDVVPELGHGPVVEGEITLPVFA